MASAAEAPAVVVSPAAKRAARPGLIAAAVIGGLLVVLAAVGAVAAGVGWRLLVDSYTFTNVVIGISLLVSGLLIAWHRPRNVVGPLLLASGFGHLVSGAATMIMLYAAGAGWPLGLTRTLGTLANGAWQVGLGLLFPIALLLFPDGHLPSRRWRPLLWLLVVTGSYQTMTGIFSDGSPLGDDPRYTSIVSVGLEVPYAINEAFGYATLLGWLLVIVSMVVRYYRGGDRERRQLQWLLLAVLVDLLINTQRVITAEGPILLLLSFVTIPIAIGIAVVRYQLLDIQLVVSRTLLYGLVIARGDRRVRRHRRGPVAGRLGAGRARRLDRGGDRRGHRLQPPAAVDHEAGRPGVLRHPVRPGDDRERGRAAPPRRRRPRRCARADPGGAAAAGAEPAPAGRHAWSAPPDRWTPGRSIDLSADVSGNGGRHPAGRPAPGREACCMPTTGAPWN